METYETLLSRGAEPGRLARAKEMVDSGTAVETITYYKATPTNCQCPDHVFGHECKHMLAARLLGIVESAPQSALAATPAAKEEAGKLAASLAVKSVRIGWPAGLSAGLRVLGVSKMKSLLWAQVWEDIYPAPEELAAVGDEIAALDFVALCRRQTHHGQPGKTEEWFRLREKPADYKRVVATVKRFDPRAQVCPRVLACANCWVLMNGGLPGIIRDLDVSPWAGVPGAMFDVHAVWQGRRGAPTFLSGFWERHVELARLVQEPSMGWRYIRGLTHSSVVPGTEAWELAMEVVVQVGLI